jgi:hypothetical protein
MSLVGDWKVSLDWRVDGVLMPVADARATIASASGGCSVVEQLRGVLRETPIAVTTLIAAPDREGLQLAYVDSEHGDLLLFDGRESGNTVQFRWSRDLGERRVVVRREYGEITTRSFVMQAFMSPDGGTNWTLVQRALYDRTR